MTVFAALPSLRQFAFISEVIRRLHGIGSCVLSIACRIRLHRNVVKQKLRNYRDCSG